MPKPRLFSAISILEGATFYSLQMGPPAGQIASLGNRVRIVDLQDDQEDLADTAAIVANLELVISIDTSIAHLVGAMGKPVCRGFQEKLGPVSQRGGEGQL